MVTNNASNVNLIFTLIIAQLWCLIIMVFDCYYEGESLMLMMVLLRFTIILSIINLPCQSTMISESPTIWIWLVNNVILIFTTLVRSTMILVVFDGSWLISDGYDGFTMIMSKIIHKNTMVHGYRW